MYLLLFSFFRYSLMQLDLEYNVPLMGCGTIFSDNKLFWLCARKWPPLSHSMSCQHEKVASIIPLHVMSTPTPLWNSQVFTTSSSFCWLAQGKFYLSTSS